MYQQETMEKGDAKTDITINPFCPEQLPLLSATLSEF